MTRMPPTWSCLLSSIPSSTFWLSWPAGNAALELDIGTTRVAHILVRLRRVQHHHEPGTQDMQIACFENVAAHLQPGGRFVVEIMVLGVRHLYESSVECASPRRAPGLSDAQRPCPLGRLGIVEHGGHLLGAGEALALTPRLNDRESRWRRASSPARSAVGSDGARTTSTRSDGPTRKAPFPGPFGVAGAGFEPATSGL
jgi:hypothetical protein